MMENRRLHVELTEAAIKMTDENSKENQFSFMFVCSRRNENYFLCKRPNPDCIEFCRIPSVKLAHWGMAAVFPAKCDVM